MTSKTQTDTSSVIRQLPRSTDSLKWMFGFEVLLGLKPFTPIHKNTNSITTDLNKSRPLIVSSVSSWGMFFYLIHSISYTTSIVLWIFTDIFSLDSIDVGFMTTIIVLYVVFMCKYILNNCYRQNNEIVFLSSINVHETSLLS